MRSGKAKRVGTASRSLAGWDKYKRRDAVSRVIPTDDRSPHYIEAAINGILIGNLYLPNGDPKPGPKFDYKLRWFNVFQTTLLNSVA